MLDFSGKDQKAQQICLHYANQLGADSLVQIIECKLPVSSKDEAIALSRFFWQMLDASIDDKDNGVDVLGEQNLQYWMERNMNIISGYLTKIGYEEQWEKICDEA